MLDLKDINTKKEILIDLDKAEKILKKITMNTADIGIEWLHHTRISIGYLRDAIITLNNEIIKNGAKLL